MTLKEQIDFCKSKIKQDADTVIFQALLSSLEKLSKAGKSSSEEEKELFNKCKTIFYQAYERYTGLAYSWGAKEGSALKQLLKKLCGLASLSSKTDDEIEKAFLYLLENLPEWYRANGFSVSVINSKFNEIIASVKNERTNKKGITSAYKEGIARELLSQDDE